MHDTVTMPTPAERALMDEAAPEIERLLARLEELRREEEDTITLLAHYGYLVAKRFERIRRQQAKRHP